MEKELSKKIGRLRGDRVLVLPDPVNEKTDSGIIYKPVGKQEEEKENMVYGTIMGLGPGDFKEDGTPDGAMADLEIGQRIIFGKYSGSEVKIKEVDYKIMRELDVAIVLDESA